jgi:hypothetical protein
MTPEPPTTSVRRKACARIGAPAAALLLFLASPGHALPGKAPGAPVAEPAPSFSQRSAVEKASRSRYRDLEVASLVLILVAGGAAVWWTFRRK